MQGDASGLTLARKQPDRDGERLVGRDLQVLVDDAVVVEGRDWYSREDESCCCHCRCRMRGLRWAVGDDSDERGKLIVAAAAARMRGARWDRTAFCGCNA